MFAFRIGQIEVVCAVGAAVHGVLLPSPRVPADRQAACAQRVPEPDREGDCFHADPVETFGLFRQPFDELYLALKPVSKNLGEVDRHRADVGGKIAQLRGRLIQGTANKLVRGFCDNFARRFRRGEAA